ncbi:hypothetical protein PICSAR10_01449 [Mycobacterium avium subsp. paratuberculosis]|nr:hypothetical protein PICSAR10_01449 [Mycobacterium avium subsp. paratuberculosis]
MLERQQYRVEGVHPRARVADRVRVIGGAIRVAGEPTQPGRGFDDVGECRVVPPRPGEPEAGHPHHDRVGANRLHGGEIQSDRIQHPRGEVLHDHVAGGDEPPQHVPAAWALQVQGQALLVGVQGLEDGGLLPPPVLADGHPGDQPGAVGTAGGLHVDDLGAEHGHKVGAAGARPECGEVQHPKSVERQRCSTSVGCGPWRQFRAAVALGVLTEARRRMRRAQLRRVHPVGVSRLQEAVARIAHEGPALTELIERRDIRPVGHRGVRDAEGRCQFPDFFDGSAGHPREDLVGVDVGQLGDRQRRVLVDPLRVTHHGAQVEPLLGGAAADVHQAVLGLRHARHGRPPGVTPGPAEHLEVGDRVVGEAQDLCLQHGQVQQFSWPAVDSAPARRQGGRAGIGPGQIFADLTADEDGRAVLLAAPEADDSSRPGLQGELGGRPVPPGAFQPERGDRGDGEMGVAGLDRTRREVVVLGHRGPARPDHRVRRGQ